MRNNYQIGIQKAVLDAIVQGQKMGLDYVTKQQIIESVSKVMELKDPQNQVGQALYQLSQRNSKFKNPRIKKFIEENKHLGWVPVEEEVARLYPKKWRHQQHKNIKNSNTFK